MHKDFYEHYYIVRIIFYHLQEQIKLTTYLLPNLADSVHRDPDPPLLISFMSPTSIERNKSYLCVQSGTMIQIY